MVSVDETPRQLFHGTLACTLLRHDVGGRRTLGRGTADVGTWDEGRGTKVNIHSEGRGPTWLLSRRFDEACGGGRRGTLLLRDDVVVEG